MQNFIDTNSNDNKTGVFQVGKRFESYFDGELIGTSYNLRSAEIFVEKRMGTYVDGRTKRKNSDMELSYAESYSEPIIDTRTDDEIYNDIQNRFQTMDLMVHAAITGLNRSMIVSGPAGVGKSAGIMAALESSGSNFTVVKGHVTPQQLYALFFNNRSSDSIVCFDDADSIFAHEVSLNILKAACDSTDERNLSWYSSKAIEDTEGGDIPSTFTFNGSVIFITNKDFDSEIMNDNKMSCHFEALRSRSHYVSLGIHNKRDYIIRIKQVVNNTNILGDFTNTEKAAILVFIVDNKDKMVELSLRVVKKLSDLLKISPDGWKDIAKVTLMR